MPIITLDFETYYSRQYSLRKQTTEEYIRHKRFETIGVGVKVGEEETQWFSGTKKKTKEFLDQFDWANSALLAHNAAFDGAILNWHYDIRPARILDTMSMSRAVHGTEISASLASLARHYELGEKGTAVHDAIGKRRLDFSPEELTAYGEYCRLDVDLTHALFYKLRPRVPTPELKLIDLTIRMFSEPALVIDTPLLERHLADLQEQKKETLKTAGVSKEELMSNPKFADALRGFGVTPPMKASPATGKETYAFAKSDEEFKALLEHDDVRVQTLVGARLKVKSTLEETRTQRFLDIAGRGTMPIPLRYYAAHTGRWGGDDKINMQNLPRTSPLKNALLAPPGYVIIDSDSSQIEARTLAWLAEQDDLTAAFAAGDDVYKIMACKLYDKEEADITKGERFVGKTTILGCGYGMGPPRFQDQLASFDVDISAAMAASVISKYRETYAKIPKLWRQADRSLNLLFKGMESNLGRGGLIDIAPDIGLKLPNSLTIRYPNLREENRTEGNDRKELVYDTKRGASAVSTRIYGPKLIENVCQALARIIIGEQMLLIAKKYKAVMTVHDAVTCVVREDQADEAKAHIETCMKTAPSWAEGLPLNCETGIGKSYGGCK